MLRFGHDSRLKINEMASKLRFNCRAFDLNFGFSVKNISLGDVKRTTYSNIQNLGFLYEKSRKARSLAIRSFGQI